MRYAVLGPLTVHDGERPVPIPALMERLLLATLLVARGSTVSVDRLTESLWSDSPPRSAGKTLQTYVSHLRRRLGDHRLVTERPGYRLHLDDDDEVDAMDFEQRMTRGRLALLRRDPTTANRCFEAALALWRGPAYADLADREPVRGEVARLEELRISVLEDWIEARLDGSEGRGVEIEIEQLVVDHPLRERLWALLMRALYLAGRQAEALAAYQRARVLLVEELGIEPGPELRAMEAAVLRHDPVLDPAEPDTAPTRYARTDDDIEIAYRVLGTGDRQIVFVLEWTMNVELMEVLSSFQLIIARLRELGRVTLVQRRDSGISGRSEVGFTPPAGCVPDLDAVLRDVGADRVVLVGWGHGGQVALAYAAARPERVTGVAALSGYPRLSATDDHPHGIQQKFLDDWLDEMKGRWGEEMPLFPLFSPDVAFDPSLIAAMARMNRLTMTPAQAVAAMRQAYSFDVRPLLADVRCPVLVVGLRESITALANARALADLLPQAEWVELPGYFVPSLDDARAIGEVVSDFVARLPDGA